jgi:hypothetical protein
MLKVLYGSLSIKSKSDLFILIPKLIYIIYTLPFLVFAFLLALRSLGGFGNPLKEEFGITKKILLHFAAVVISFGIWIIVLGFLEEKLGIKIRLHLF